MDIVTKIFIVVSIALLVAALFALIKISVQESFAYVEKKWESTGAIAICWPRYLLFL